MKPLLEQTFYELLEVEPGAGDREVAGALERARALWADESGPTYSLLGDEERRSLIGRLEEAGRTLLDPARRIRYHESLGLAPPPASPGAPRPAAAPPARAEAAPGPAPAAEKDMPRLPVRPRLVRLPQSRAAAPSPLSALPRAIPSGMEPLASRAEPARLSPAPQEPPPPGPEKEAEGATPPTAVPPRPDPADFFRTARDARGENFRRYREACGIELRDMARQTRISRMHLENIEADAYAQLPAQVYIRGFLEAYCRYLKLEAGPLVRGYLEHLAQYTRLHERT